MRKVTTTAVAPQTSTVVEVTSKPRTVARRSTRSGYQVKVTGCPLAPKNTAMSDGAFDWTYAIGR